MARKPAANSKRAAFAALLAGHLSGGTRPATATGEPWTYAAFSGEIEGARGNLHASASSVSNWCNGASLPAEIVPILRALFGPDTSTSTRHAEAREELRRAFQAARAERIAGEKPDPAGPRWVVSGDQIVIDRGVRPADRDAADDPVRQHFQQEIARLAGELVHRAARLTNTLTWGALSGTAAAFQATLSADPHTLPARLGSAYTQLLLLGGFLETDIRVQNDPAATDGPLGADIHGLLTALVRTAAPWLRGFPTVEAWDNEAGKALLRPELFQPAREFVHIARDRHVIPEQDAAEIAALGEALGEAGGKAGYQQTKAGNRSNAVVMNLILRTAMTFAFGAVASDFATHSTLVQRAGAALADGAAAVEAFAATRSADLRQALLALTREGRQVDAPTPTALPVKVDPLVPEDVEKQAQRMILAGHAPPEAWRPFILHLSFFGEMALTDVAPLAGLIALQSLDLTDTQVSDVAPLAGLIALQNLSLGNTQVSDVAPLAGLTTLRMLDLTGTQVSDFAPLAGLIALQTLSLAGTEVSDVAPLAGLIALQNLDLSYTHVSDVAPLAGLIALRRLDLSSTPVRDISALDRLVDLEIVGGPAPRKGRENRSRRRSSVRK